MIKTTVIISRYKDNNVESQKIELPCENEDGFHGILELVFKAGKIVNASVPRETLKIKDIK